MGDGWHRTEDGRLVKRYGVPRSPIHSRSSFPTPQIMSGGFAEPVQSMADGKFYTDKAALARSHRASGNPQGVDYVELGNDSAPMVEHVPNPAKRRDDVQQAAADVKAGNIPDWIKAIG